MVIKCHVEVVVLSETWHLDGVVGGIEVGRDGSGKGDI